MKPVYATLLISAALSGCSPLPNTYLGRWMGDDRPTLGIMAGLDITRDKIMFGNGGNINAPLACSADYSAEQDSSTGGYKLSLQNKQCDYKRALNPGHLKDITSLGIYLSKNPFGTKMPYAKTTLKETEKPNLFIQSMDGSTDYRFTRVE